VAAIGDPVEVGVVWTGAVVAADDRLRRAGEVVLGAVPENDTQLRVLLARERARTLVALVVGGHDELAALQRLERRLMQARPRRIVQVDLRMPAVATAPLLQVIAQPTSSAAAIP
jgi:hypothetical protein